MVIKEWIKSSWMPILIIIVLLSGLALFLPEVTADPISLQDTIQTDWFELERIPTSWACDEEMTEVKPGVSTCLGNMVETEWTLDKPCAGVNWDFKQAFPIEYKDLKVPGLNHYKYCVNEITLKNPTTDFLSTTDFIYRITDMFTGSKDIEFLIEDPNNLGYLIPWEVTHTKSWDVGLSTKIYAYGTKHNAFNSLEWDFNLTYKPLELSFYKDPFWDGSGGENASARLVIDGRFYYDQFNSYSPGDKNPGRWKNATDFDGAPGSDWTVVDVLGVRAFNASGVSDTDAHPIMINDTNLGTNFTVISKTALFKMQSQYYNPVFVRGQITPSKNADFIHYEMRNQPSTDPRYFKANNGTGGVIIQKLSEVGFMNSWEMGLNDWRLQKLDVWGTDSLNVSLGGSNLKDYVNWTNVANLTGTNASLFSNQVGFGITTNGRQAVTDNFRAFGIADQNYLDTEISNITGVAIFSDAEGDAWVSRNCHWDFNNDGTTDLIQTINSPSGLNVNCTVTSDSWGAGDIHLTIEDCDDAPSCANTTTENTITLALSNQPPVMDNVNISSYRGWNTSGENLLGGFNWSDPDADSFTNETLWWKDGSAIAALDDLQEISSSNTSAGETWAFSARVNDGTVWSSWKNSSNLTINTLPTQDTPILNASNVDNRSNRNLTIWNQTTADVNDNPIKNIINWYKSGGSITVLNMPFEGGSRDGTDAGVANGARDYSGYWNNGTVYNTTVWNSTGGFDGKGAYKFDDIDDKIDYGNDASLDLINEVSVAAWFNLDNASQGNIINKYGAYILSTNMQGWLQFTVWLSNTNASYTVMNSTSSFTSGWHFLTGTYDGSALNLYLDGVLQKTETNLTYPSLSGGISTSANSLFSGGNKGICLGEMVYIDKLGGYCIDKYEATAWNSDGTYNTTSNTSSSSWGSTASTDLITKGGYANSSYDKYPWVFVKSTEAMTACEAHPDNNKYLCTNEEWLAAANIQGQIYDLPAQITDCNVVSGQPAICENIGPSLGDACKTGYMNNCTSLEGVYDMVGNVAEWTNGSIDLIINPLGNATVGTGTANYFYINQTNLDWTTSSANSAKYGNDGTYFPTTDTNRAVARGEYWLLGPSTGPFATRLSLSTSSTANYLGFRCCSTPS